MALARTNHIHEMSSSGFGTGPYTTASFTPSSSGLLVVFIGQMQNGTSGGASFFNNITPSGGGWTYTRQKTTPASSNNFSPGIVVWTAPVTTGASMTLSIALGGNDALTVQVMAVSYTGYNTGSPVGATINKILAADGADSMTLSGTPATTSEVIGARMGNSGGTSGTMLASPGTNHTEIWDDSINDTCGLQLQVQNDGSESTTFSWADVNNGTAAGPGEMCGLAIEIQVAAAAGIPYPQVIIPVAASQQAANW